MKAKIAITITALLLATSSAYAYDPVGTTVIDGQELNCEYGKGYTFNATTRQQLIFCSEKREPSPEPSYGGSIPVPESTLTPPVINVPVIYETSTATAVTETITATSNATPVVSNTTETTTATIQSVTVSSLYAQIMALFTQLLALIAKLQG
jgi:hypothetical protein